MTADLDLSCVAERATELATRYGEAIVEIHEALDDDTLSPAARIVRVRLIIAGLDTELQTDEGDSQ